MRHALRLFSLLTFGGSQVVQQSKQLINLWEVPQTRESLPELTWKTDSPAYGTVALVFQEPSPRLTWFLSSDFSPGKWLSWVL